MARTAAAPDTTTALAKATDYTTALAVNGTADVTDRRGKENLDSQDLVLGRLAIAQKTRPQVDPSKSDYIDGVKIYDIFHSLSGANFGRGPVEFVVLGSRKKAIQFDAESKVVDFDVPLDDPRCQFTDGPN